MAQPLLDDALWARLEPLLPKPVAVRGDAADGPTSCRATVATIRNHIVIGSPFAMNATTASITPSSH